MSKQLAPGVSIEIMGSVMFSSEGLTKDQMAKWEPLLTGVRISYSGQGHSIQEVLPIPGVATTTQVLRYRLVQQEVER